MALPSSRFKVEYFYQRPGNAPTRTVLSTNTSQLGNASTRSETAVLGYLRKRHPGFDIQIVSLEFQDTTGRPV